MTPASRRPPTFRVGEGSVSPPLASQLRGDPERFRAVILIRDGNPFVPVTAGQAARLRPGRRAIPVLVTIEGQPDPPWRINLMPAGDGTFYLYLHGAVRKASATAVGDSVEVALWFDEGYDSEALHPMPPWFRTELAEDTTAKANWEALPPSRRKEVLRYFAWLKSDDARQRNLAKAMHVLSGRPGRFLARDWQNGS